MTKTWSVPHYSLLAEPRSRVRGADLPYDDGMPLESEWHVNDEDGQLLPTPQEAEARRAEAADRRAEAADRRAEGEARRAEVEAAARRAAETRLAELEAELRALRGNKAKG